MQIDFNLKLITSYVWFRQKQGALNSTKMN